MKRVLVVDDEPDIRTVVSQVLRDAGYIAFVAANGAEALNRMRKALPHAVLLDLNMPVMDGETFLRLCRADPDLAAVPVAVITAEHNPARLTQTLDVQAFLAKPFDLDEIVDLVDRLVLASADAPEAAEPTEPTTWWRYPPDLHQRRIAGSTRLATASLALHSEATIEGLTRSRGLSAGARSCLTRATARLNSSRTLLSAAG